MNLLDLIISVAVEDGNAQNSLNQLNEKAEGIGSKFKNVGLGIAKFGAVVATGVVAAGASIGAIAKPLVEAAADAAAMNAQFEQVFGELDSTAQKTIDGLGESFGMLPSRLKGSFTSISSMFKGFGMSTEESMAAATNAVTLAADAAAFYDVAMSDSEGAITSFLKGNTNAAESIGIFATAAGMASFASDELGLNWKKLDEGGKQLVRLEYVKKMQEAAGATGQAARESNGLENQLGNLKQAWKDIQAKFGEPILEPAVAMIGKLAGALVNFDVEPIIERFKIFGSFINTHVIAKFKEMKPQISAAIDNVKGVFDTFVAFIDTHFVSKFNEIKPVIVNVIDTVKGVVGGFIDFVKGVFSGEGNIGESFVRIFNVIKTVAIPILEDAVSFVKSTLAKLKKFWDENGAQITQAVKNLWSSIATIFEFFLPAIQAIVTDVWGTIKSVISGALDIIMGVIKVFSGIFTGDFDKMWEGIKQVFSGAVEAIWGVLQLGFLGRIFKIIKGFGGQAVDVVTGMGTKMKGKFDDIVTSATEKFNAVKNAVMKPINTMKDKVKEAIDFVKEMFDKLKLKLPEIKTPKFKLKNWSINPIDWLDKMPSIGVSWNAKGGVFKKPTLFNTANAGMQGVGEAGAEAILPLNASTFEGIGTPIAVHVGKILSEMLAKGKNGVHVINNIYSNELDEITLARQQRKQLEKLGTAW